MPLLHFASEAVVVVGDKFLDFLEGIEAFKDSVLEDGVELVLDTGEQRILLVHIKTELLESCFPVKLVQVKQVESVNDLTHAGLHFSLVQELLMGQDTVLLWQPLAVLVKPWILAFKARIEREGA